MLFISFETKRRLEATEAWLELITVELIAAGYLTTTTTTTMHGASSTPGNTGPSAR